MKKIFPLFFLLFNFQEDILGQAIQDPGIALRDGHLWRIADFPSKYIPSRHVDIWLPPNYDSASRYPVLYMHDGQMLFDSNSTWNKQEWQVDEMAGKLIQEGRLPPFIVVGIWNIPSIRHTEYFPQKPYESLSPHLQDSLYGTLRPNNQSTFNGGRVQADNYLQFLVKELKPWIDGHFSTLPDRKHTSIAGSSMGGLISLYAICEYPEVFGQAACLSTHWPGVFSVENNPIPDAFYRYMLQHLPDPATHRIYFDLGDQTLDALYPPLQKKADEVMRKKGFGENNWVTKFFPGTDHSEKAWSGRLDGAMLFLMDAR